jgi:hypothetical protein
MMFKQRLLACAAAAGSLILATILPAQETNSPSGKAPALTLATIVKDLEDKAGKLSAERSAKNPESKEEGKIATAFDHEKATAASDISRCLIRRSNLARNKTTPSDPYYLAIQNQLHADADLETLKTWWKHCRKGTAYESLANLEQLPLTAELMTVKNQADKSVADHKPIPDTPDPENPGIKPLDSSVSSRLKGNKGILDQINGWTNLPEEAKSKIIAR